MYLKKISHIFFVLFIAAVTICGCMKGDRDNTDEAMAMSEENYPEIKGDSMLYGLSCDGTSDSVVVIWPFKGDPVTFSIIDAKNNGHVIGSPEIGDWIGIMLNQEDKSMVDMLIDLDQLKATWTYPVMPVMKDLQHMSRRAQRRMMAHINDSIKKNYLIPREYGFTLKRSHNAQPVGRVMRANSLEDDSPVSYPKVNNYRKWYMLNGRLILISADRMSPDSKTKPVYHLDTLDFVSMLGDSLILTQHGIRYGFHRKENALEANKNAQQKESTKK